MPSALHLGCATSLLNTLDILTILERSCELRVGGLFIDLKIFHAAFEPALFILLAFLTITRLAVASDEKTIYLHCQDDDWDYGLSPDNLRKLCRK